MSFSDICHLSLENLWRTKLRTLLTTLGVVIGIGVLVSMVSFGSGIQKNVSESFRENDLFTTLEALPAGVDLARAASGDTKALAGITPLTDAELTKIRNLPGVEMAFPNVRFPVKVRMEGRETTTTLQAMPAAVGEYRPYSALTYGRFFIDDGERSVVLSPRLLSELGIRLAEDPEPAQASKGNLNEVTLTVHADSLLGRSVEIITSVLDQGGLARAFLEHSPESIRAVFGEELVRLTIVGIGGRPTGFAGRASGGGVIVPMRTAEGIPHLGFSHVWDLLGRGARTMDTHRSTFGLRA